MLAESYPDVFVIDIWPKSMNTEHTDNTHWIPQFYEELARMFIRLGGKVESDVNQLQQSSIWLLMSLTPESSTKCGSVSYDSARSIDRKL